MSNVKLLDWKHLIKKSKTEIEKSRMWVSEKSSKSWLETFHRAFIGRKANLGDMGKFLSHWYTEARVDYCNVFYKRNKWVTYKGKYFELELFFKDLFEDKNDSENYYCNGTLEFSLHTGLYGEEEVMGDRRYSIKAKIPKTAVLNYMKSKDGYGYLNKVSKYFVKCYKKYVKHKKKYGPIGFKVHMFDTVTQHDLSEAQANKILNSDKYMIVPTPYPIDKLFKDDKHMVNLCDRYNEVYFSNNVRYVLLAGPILHGNEEDDAPIELFRPTVPIVGFVESDVKVPKYQFEF